MFFRGPDWIHFLATKILVALLITAAHPPVLPHLESMQPDSILDRVGDIEKYDRLARRKCGLSDDQGRSSSLGLNVLAGRGRTLIVIEQQPNPHRHRKTNLKALSNRFYLL